MAKKINGIADLYPKDEPPYLLDAWLSCLSWAARESEIIEEFIRTENPDFIIPNSPIDKMIIDATDANRPAIESFILWFNENV